MFDELAGVFSTSSVQQSRQMNETVGGMRLMSGAANAVSEFDLRLWVETWVEPVIRQLAHLVKYYETDDRMLALSNAAAQTQRKFQHQPTLDDFEQVELFVRVNAGIGALDPMQKLSKLKVAFEMLAPIMPIMQEQGIKLKAEALVEEVMGAAGFRDGMRFFEMSEGPAEPKQDPELQKFLEEMKVEREKMAQDFKMTVLELQAENQRNLLDNRTKVQIEQLRGKRELGRDLLGIHADRESRSEARQETQRDRMFGVMKDAVHTNRAKLQAQAKQAPQNEPQEDDNDLLARLEEVEAREEQIIEALKAIQQQLVRAAPQPTMQ
jgi:FMN phosphatase YigB (HAD superfamily)